MDKNEIIQNAPPHPKFEEIDKFILKLSEKLFVNNHEETFYEFAKNRFIDYIEVLELLDKSILEELLISSEEMMGRCTKDNFLHIVKNIQDNCLSILEDYYKGDVFSSLLNLDKLMRMGAPSSNLKDNLANYFCLSSISKDKKLFRSVDWGLDEDLPKVNCWHVPYHLRNKANPSRFNFWGHICMYLSMSEECANNELGKLSDNKRRWTGVFTPSRNLFLMNLYFPTTEQEICKLDSYDKFCLLLTYPFFILCLTQSSKDKTEEQIMPEEYFFPQLFLHLIFLSENNLQPGIDYPKFDGIIYNSMVDKNVANLVIPAKYEGRIPPICGYSPYLKTLFKEYSNPYPSNLNNF